MSLKDQTPFFSDPPPWYYRFMAVLCVLVILLFSYPSVLCLLGHEYWPLLIFGVGIFCMVISARGLWQRARIKENERFKQQTTPDD
jgi:uncharacterized membrane protein YvlD (DUF360 family)